MAGSKSSITGEDFYAMYDAQVRSVDENYLSHLGSVLQLAAMVIVAQGLSLCLSGGYCIFEPAAAMPPC